MIARYISIIIILLFVFNSTYGQRKFKVEVKVIGAWKQVFTLVDEQGNKIIQLDSSKYYASFYNDQYGYFAIFGKRDSPGWVAIDACENELFRVFNTSFGEPSPDFLVENKIRLVDENGRIGFANNKGEIIITPQFEMVTSFHNGKAIIGQKCTKVPWNKHPKESDCHHYSIICKEQGYINENGSIIKIGDYSFDQIRKEINWKSPYE